MHSVRIRSNTVAIKLEMVVNSFSDLTKFYRELRVQAGPWQ